MAFLQLPQTPKLQFIRFLETLFLILSGHRLFLITLQDLFSLGHSLALHLGVKFLFTSFQFRCTLMACHYLIRFLFQNRLALSFQHFLSYPPIYCPSQKYQGDRHQILFIGS